MTHYLEQDHLTALLTYNSVYMQSYNLAKDYSAVVPESKDNMPIYASFDMSRNH